MPILLDMTNNALGQGRFNERMVRSGFWDKMKAIAGRVSFAREAVAAWYCATDSATPARTKAVLFGALAYFIAPIDMIPDFLAGLGFTDDAAVFWLAWRSVQEHVTDVHRERAAQALSNPERE